jgi:nucleoside-diphosphate-sugar epimerase
MEILVTGANGYIGNAICEKLSKVHTIHKLSRDLFDLTDSTKVDEYFLFKKFDVVIHCAVQGGSRLKSETFSMMDANLQMYYNLLRHSDKFDKFINIGSGAELHSKHTPYGLSKHVIRSSMSEKQNFYNLRVFGLFDENELETRFIHSNIKRYIESKPIEVNEIKKMDFIYMYDFLNIVEFYLTENTVPKELNCCYETKVNLIAVANIISNLDSHTVPININQNAITRDYIGTYDQFVSEIPLIGLETGIKNVYTKLKERYATN